MDRRQFKRACKKLEDSKLPYMASVRANGQIMLTGNLSLPDAINVLLTLLANEPEKINALIAVLNKHLETLKTEDETAKPLL